MGGIGCEHQIQLLWNLAFSEASVTGSLTLHMGLNHCPEQFSEPGVFFGWLCKIRLSCTPTLCVCVGGVFKLLCPFFFSFFPLVQMLYFEPHNLFFSVFFFPFLNSVKACKFCCYGVLRRHFRGFCALTMCYFLQGLNHEDASSRSLPSPEPLEQEQHRHPLPHVTDPLPSLQHWLCGISGWWTANAQTTCSPLGCVTYLVGDEDCCFRLTYWSVLYYICWSVQC